MKILLLGDYSGVHQTLKQGLVLLGHEVTVASTGDEWKNIQRDLDLKKNFPSMFGKIEYRIKLLNHLINSFKGYDVVQLVNALSFNLKYFPSKYFINTLIQNNHSVFLLAAGSDAFYWKYGKERMSYGPFDDILKYDLKATKHPYQSENVFAFNKYVADNVCGIIPVMFDYYTSYSPHNNLTSVIPLPVNLQKIKYEPNVVKNKVVIFHGLNRYGFKGTSYIEKAFALLKNRYPKDLEMIIDGKMPLDEYLRLMRRTNILIDQTSTYSLGLNGIYALAMGKVVLGGAEPDSLKCFGVTQSPVINIRPNVENIVYNIEKLLNKKQSIYHLGNESRKFAEKVHCHLKVAKQFLKVWQTKTLKRT